MAGRSRTNRALEPFLSSLAHPAPPLACAATGKRVTPTEIAAIVTASSVGAATAIHRIRSDVSTPRVATPAAIAVTVPLAILESTAPPASATGRPQPGRQDAPLAPISRRTQPIRASQPRTHARTCATPGFTAPAAAARRARPVPGHLATRFLTVRLTARATTASVQSPPFALWSPLPATAATSAPFCAFCPLRCGILTGRGGDST